MDFEKIISELHFKAVRSSGPGGQNVNKVSSKVVLTFDLMASNQLDDEQKQLLVKNWSARLTTSNILIINCDENRSQIKNKEIVTNRFLNLLQNGLVIPKLRKPTKIPKSVIKKRIKDKKNTSEIKQNRKQINL